MMGERGAVYSLVVGFVALILSGVLWWAFDTALDEPVSYIENTTDDNSLTRAGGVTGGKIWSVIPIFFIIIIVLWMFSQTQRKGGG